MSFKPTPPSLLKIIPKSSLFATENERLELMVMMEAMILVLLRHESSRPSAKNTQKLFNVELEMSS